MSSHTNWQKMGENFFVPVWAHTQIGGKWERIFLSLYELIHKLAENGREFFYPCVSSHINWRKMGENFFAPSLHNIIHKFHLVFQFYADPKVKTPRASGFFSNWENEPFSYRVKNPGFIETFDFKWIAPSIRSSAPSALLPSLGASLSGWDCISDSIQCPFQLIKFVIYETYQIKFKVVIIIFWCF